MINITLFKKIVSETIPLDLNQKIQAHIEKICSRYEEAVTEEGQRKQFEYEQVTERYNEIRKEFNNENEKNWIIFAKERWPEIEEYFNLVKEVKTSSPNLISREDWNEVPF